MSKEKLIVNEQFLEDIIYIALVKSYQLTLSCPKVIVTPESKRAFNVHFVFPMMGDYGEIADEVIDFSKFKGNVKDFVNVIQEFTTRVIENLHSDIDENNEEDE